MASLGQVEKRLEIIKIAITITDQETIDLQKIKLRRHKKNKQLDNILSVIEDENYAQASHLIERYLGTSIYTQEKKVKKEITKEAYLRVAKDREEEELIKQFGLFREPGRRESISTIFEDDEDNSISPIPKTVELEFDDVESDLIITEQDDEESPNKQLTTEEIIAQYDNMLIDNIPEKVTIPTTTANKQDQEIETPLVDEHMVDDVDIEIDVEEYEIEEYKLEPQPHIEIEENKDSFRDEIESFDDRFNRELVEEFREVGLEHIEDRVADINKLEIDHVSTHESDIQLEESPIEHDEEQILEEDHIEDDIQYEAISYIDQKVRNMLNQYPQVIENVECFDSEEELLHKISLNGYSEKDIRLVIDHIYDLTNEGKLDEASHLLLIVASTESLYAQFILARELYKGRILQKNTAEAFTQISQLAQDQYPEAICDLAQFYEHGIGTNKNRKKAFRLYEDAYDLGVDRADKHLTKMEEESKGILSKLFNRNFLFSLFFIIS